MTDLLMLAHILQFFGLIAFNVKINVPVRPTLASLKSVVLQRVYYAFVLPSVYFVPHLSPLQWEHQTRVELVRNAADGRILKKYCCRSAFESTTLQINLAVLVFLHVTIIGFLFVVSTRIVFIIIIILGPDQFL